MNLRTNTNSSKDEDENDSNEWSENCLYRRMLRGSQRIQMMKRHRSSSDNSNNNNKSILEQALDQAELELSIQTNGIKVLRIHLTASSKKKTFDMRYFSIDSKRQHICLTPEPPSAMTPPLQSSSLYVDVADIDAWHVGTVATRRAELARFWETTRSSGNSSFDQVATEKLLTIYYKGFGESIDLVVPVSQQMNLIVASLTEIHTTFHRTQPWISKESSLLRYICNNCITMQSQDQIALEEFVKVCDFLKVGEDADPAFCFQSRTHQNSLPISETLPLLKYLKPQQTQATVLWDFLFGADTHTITHKQLHSKFLAQIQSEGHLSMRQAQALLTFIQTIEVNRPNGNTEPKSLPKDQFEEFLYSDLNDAYDPQIQQLNPRLDKPLSCYYINTSFKTYNTKGAEASVEGYMKALIRGAKCLDLDCWNGPSGIPVVGSARATNKKQHLLEFRHVCEIVQAYMNMHPDSYPIIISIENYCSPPFQESMVSILQEILGQRLVLPNQSSWDSLPSPEALKGRVLLHAKAYPEVVSNEKEWFQRQQEEDSESKERKSLLGMMRLDSAVVDHEVVEMIDALQQVVFLHGGKVGEDSSDNNNNNNKVLSCPHSQIQEHRQHTAASHLTRIHPTSLEKACPNPIQAWSLGCQMVALKFGDSVATVLSDGLFRQQNGVGYVLMAQAQSSTPISLFVRVLGGKCLPNQQVQNGNSTGNNGKSQEISVAVTLYDVTSDNHVYQDVHKTESVEDGNRFAPVWKDRGKQFAVEQPHVAMVLFQVLISNEVLASAAIPVSCLRKGYRSIQFFDDNNCRTGALRYASLLVHIEY